jgi:ATP-binding cassette subfamily B protein
VTPRAPSSRRADRLLVSIGVHGGPAVGLLSITALTIAVAETAFPAVLGRAVDAALRDHSGASWLTWAALLVAALVVADALDELALGRVTARSTAWARTLLARHILSLGTRATERFPVGDLVGRVVGSTVQAGGIAPVAIRAVANLIPAIGAPVALALIDPWLCVTFLAAVPVLMLLVRALTGEAQGVAEKYLAVQGEIAGRLVEALSGVRTIAAAGKLDYETGRVLEALPDLHRHGLGAWRAQMRIAAQSGLLLSLTEIAVLSVAGLELARGRIAPGQLLAAGQYVLVGASMTSVLSSTNAVARARAAAGRINEVLEQEPRARGTKRLPDGAGRIELRAVTVRRGNAAILRDVDLVVSPGALIAVVGQSGAGKSLLGAIAGGLVDPDSGGALLDGVPLREIDPEELRRAVGYGFERPALIGETVADAIAFGTVEPPLDTVVEAAVAARADDFIRRLPHGYGTRLGSAPMSGGEAQRVGLARTFAHAGRVMILDDVAASLDTVTEHHISEVLLAGPLSDLTRIVIAHRVSTASRADSVVWLEGGAVRATGPHAVLWREPEYRALFGDQDTVASGRENGMRAFR